MKGRQISRNSGKQVDWLTVTRSSSEYTVKEDLIKKEMYGDLQYHWEEDTRVLWDTHREKYDIMLTIKREKKGVL